jgi:FtsZ-interacting cell division protein ZipA
MNSSTVVWIVVAVAAVIVLAALVFAARNRRNQHRHVKAEHMREEITTHVQKVDKRQALGDETAAKARAAEAEAEAKAAEAARLKEQAAGHHEAVATSREDIEQRRKHADRLDPKTRTDDEAGDEHVVEQERADQAAARQEAARQETQRG